MRAALIALAATAAPTLAQADVFPLGDRQGVTFNQIAYELPEGPATSAWGRVTVDPARVARLTGESAGFVSVRTDLGWVALNLPVQLDPEFPRAFADATIVDDGATLPVSFEFSLGAERERASLDAAVVFSTTPLLTTLNRHSLTDPKLKVVNADAWKFLEQAQPLYDLVVIDLPDPNNASLSRLYSSSFYQLVKQHVAQTGIILTQATSPLFSRQAFWCINQTLGLSSNNEDWHTLPYQ